MVHERPTAAAASRCCRCAREEDAVGPEKHKEAQRWREGDRRKGDEACSRDSQVSPREYREARRGHHGEGGYQGEVHSLICLIVTRDDAALAAFPHPRFCFDRLPTYP